MTPEERKEITPGKGLGRTAEAVGQAATGAIQLANALLEAQGILNMRVLVSIAEQPAVGEGCCVVATGAETDAELLDLVDRTRAAVLKSEQEGYTRIPRPLVVAVDVPPPPPPQAFDA